MISVIIPVYNNEEYIARCLNSLLTQTYSDFEALVINDGSKDDSGKIIQEYAAKDVRIRYFEQKNQGVSVARNKGLDNAKGEYVLFLDGDDWLDNDVLERLHNEMTEHNLDCVSYMFRHVYEDGIPPNEDAGSENIYYQLSSPSKAARFFDTTARGVFYTSQQHLFRRDIIQKNKLRFAPGVKLGEDGLFARMYSMFIKNGAVLFSFAAYNYFHHSVSCTSVNNDPWEYINQRMKCCEFFVHYLRVVGKPMHGCFVLSNLCWEFVLHLSEIVVKYPNKEKERVVLSSRCVKKVIYPYILLNASIRRKLLLIFFCFYPALFRKIIGIK